MSKEAMISVIDDDESVRFAIENLISSIGQNVRTFTSAEDYLASGSLERTLCIISDLQMPGMQGLELQQHLLSAGHNLPIIFITAFPDPLLRKKALSAGAAGFLEKPFETVELLSILDSVLAPSA